MTISVLPPAAVSASSPWSPDDLAAQQLLDDLTRARRSDPAGVAACENAVALHYLDLARTLVGRFTGHGVDRDDLVQVAREGLLKAVKGWRPQLGGGFLPYAIPMITGELRRYMRDYSTLIRRPRRLIDATPAIMTAREALGRDGHTPTDAEIAVAAGVSVQAVADDRAAMIRSRSTSLEAIRAATADDWASVPAERDLTCAEDRALLRQLLNALDHRQRRLLAMRFVEDRTQDEIGRALGISQMQVSRLLRATLHQLRQAMAADRPVSSDRAATLDVLDLLQSPGGVATCRLTRRPQPSAGDCWAVPYRGTSEVTTERGPA